MRKVLNRTLIMRSIGIMFAIVPLGTTACLAGDAVLREPTPLVRLDFESEPSGAVLGTDQVKYEGQFPVPEFVPGVTGSAWRSDGFSSFARAPLAFGPSKGLTVEFWVALESYPSSLERPIDETLPASFINDADRKSGFDVFIDTFGRWGTRVSTTNGERTIRSSDPFPLYRWVHVATTYDPADGSLSQYLDGKPVAQLRSGRQNAFLPANADLLIARSWQAAMMGIFRVNGLNAAFDNVRVFDRPLSEIEVARHAVAVAAPAALPSLNVPASRFAADLQRPSYHAMPPANWTNEPHGLIRRGDTWHMFYQGTPNGPYKTQMHWGHMVSPDLVHWTNFPDAMWPTLQTESFGFDMKGIWSGDVVTAPDGRAVAFYTSVNHSANFFNPGISMAVSPDANLLRWQKLGPVLDRAGLRDFRDPYVWQEAGEWRMIVGAAVRPKGGGVAYYRCADLFKRNCWKKQPRIAPFDQMDIGSDIWEMPVFERLKNGKFILLVNPIGGKISKYGTDATRAVYWIGKWDGHSFQPDFLKPKFLDLVPGHLSPTMDRDAGGNLVGIGIVDERRSDEAQLAAGWAHTFSLPRIWRLLADGETLGQSPLPGLSQLRLSDGAVGTEASWTGSHKIGDLGRSFEALATFTPDPSALRYGMFIATASDGSETTQLFYDVATHEIVLDKQHSTQSKDGQGPMVLRGAYDEKAFGVPRSFHVFVDHSVVDVFINNAAAFSFRIYPARPDGTQFGLIADRPASARVEAWRLGAAEKR